MLALFVATQISSQSVDAQVSADWWRDLPGKDPRLAVASDGTACIARRAGDVQAENTAVVTTCLDVAGNVLWESAYDPPQDDSQIDFRVFIEMDSQDNVYLFYTQTDELWPGRAIHYEVQKRSLRGDSAWVGRYSFSFLYGPTVWIRDVEVDAEGNAYLLAVDKPDSVAIMVTAKFDKNGGLQWAKQARGGAPGPMVPGSLSVTNDGHVYVVGIANSVDCGGGIWESDLFLKKYDPAGALVEESIYAIPRDPVPCGSTSLDYSLDTAVDDFGNLFLVFEKQTKGSGREAVITTFEPRLQELWTSSYTGWKPGRLLILKEGTLIVPFDGVIFKYSRLTGTRLRANECHYASACAEERFGGYWPVADDEDNLYVAHKSWLRSYDSDLRVRWTKPLSTALEFIGDEPPFYGRSRIHYPGHDIGVKGPDTVYVVGNVQGRVAAGRETSPGALCNFDRPLEGDHFLPGRRDSVMWHGGPVGVTAKLEYSTDLGATYHPIADVPADTTKWYWDVPDGLLTPKAKVRLRDPGTGDSLFVSCPFRIKPYVITRLDGAGDYVVYDPDNDVWGFRNARNDVWPRQWWNKFNYQSGKDPFTGQPYDQTTAGGAFASAKSEERPDWRSWVNAFGPSAIYTSPGEYRPKAVQAWKARMREWRGSCFGIAVSNAVAFEDKVAFMDRYRDFPPFASPNLVRADTVQIPGTTMELFTRQMGQEHLSYKKAVWGKTPNETLADLRDMLSQDHTTIQTLDFYNNDKKKGGGHAVLAYALEQDDTEGNLWDVWVYDNNFSDTKGRVIVVDTLDGDGRGTWEPLYSWGPSKPDPRNWGGDSTLFLIGPASSFLDEATIKLQKQSQASSAFALASDELEVYIKGSESILIQDDSGRRTGFTSDGLVVGIPESVPIFVADGSAGPPIGYGLPTGSYSVSMADFAANTINAFFFAGNQVYEYERIGASSEQEDRLHFDGNLSVANHDALPKTVRLLHIGGDAPEEQLLLTRDLTLAHGDSIRLEVLTTGQLSLVNYGSAQSYGVGLEYVSDTEREHFEHSNVALLSNTSHTYAPDWPDIGTTDLRIFVDVGNDGSVEDTLTLGNQSTDVEDQSSRNLPVEYNLAQNYPNPFSTTTTIVYSLPKLSDVTLTVYDLLGRKIAFVGVGPQPAGTYAHTFDASGLAAGIYLYRLVAGDYIDTKRMLVVK